MGRNGGGEKKVTYLCIREKECAEKGTKTKQLVWDECSRVHCGPAHLQF